MNQNHVVNYDNQPKYFLKSITPWLDGDFRFGDCKYFVEILSYGICVNFNKIKIRILFIDGFIWKK